MEHMSEHTGLISSLSLLLQQTQAARWKAAAPEQLTGAHLYLDIAKSGYLVHGVSRGMKSQSRHGAMKQTWQKYGKSTNLDQNQTSSECGQDTSACQISGHSFQAFSRDCLETQNWPVSLNQNCAKISKFNNDQNLSASESGQNTWTWQIPGHCFPCILHKMPSNPKFDPFH